MAPIMMRRHTNLHIKILYFRKTFTRGLQGITNTPLYPYYFGNQINCHGQGCFFQEIVEANFDNVHNSFVQSR